MKKKLQVFVSSTYIDLKEERQAAVEAILGSKHIPAGMELFTAGNESQLSTIKTWIDESDIYMLILGGRYGSIEEKSGKSYTHIEYEYAIENGIPVFAVVLSDAFLYRKQAQCTKEEIFEARNKEKYVEFKKYVMTKVVKEVDDNKDIKIAIKDTIADFLDRYNLIGWIKGDSCEEDKNLLKENKELAKENLQLLKENKSLKEQLAKKSSVKIGDFEFDDIVKVLKEKKITVPAKFSKDHIELKTNMFELYFMLFETYISGVTNGSKASEYSRYIFHDISPIYLAYGLVEKVRVSGVKWQRIQISALGRKFYGINELNK